MIENKLDILNLETEDDLQVYREYLSSIDSTNPFYKIELVLNNNFEDNHLKYFLFTTHGIPKVVMIFIIRNIDFGPEPSKYKDVVSPYGYSGPLISPTAAQDDLISFWDHVDSWYRNNNVITEFIRFSLNDNKTSYSGLTVPTLRNVKGVILEEKLQWEKFDKKVRNNFRKAVQNQLSFKLFFQNITNTQVENFYNIYTSTMTRRKADTELFYSLAYFKEYIHNNPNNCAVALVYLEDKPISTELLLLSDDEVFSYLGGTLSDYFNTRPNDFLKVNVLNWARKTNFKYYILGGGRTDNDQLYQYKKSFFPKDEDVIFYTGRKIVNHEVYNELLLRTKNISGESLKNEINSSTDFFPEYRINE